VDHINLLLKVSESRRLRLVFVATFDEDRGGGAGPRTARRACALGASVDVGSKTNAHTLRLGCGHLAYLADRLGWFWVEGGSKCPRLAPFALYGSKRNVDQERTLVEEHILVTVGSRELVYRPVLVVEHKQDGVKRRVRPTACHSLHILSTI
jgi:hypothetical protein